MFSISVTVAALVYVQQYNNTRIEFRRNINNECEWLCSACAIANITSATILMVESYHSDHHGN